MPLPLAYMNDMYDCCLLDAKNIAYRAVAASMNSEDHPMVILFRMICKWDRLFKPNRYFVFWDVPKGNIWRSQIYKEYKGGRPSYNEDHKSRLSDLQVVMMKLFSRMCFTQYIKDKNEADDLIWAFIKSFPDKKHLVVTSDNDAEQLMYNFENVDVFNPSNKQGVVRERPSYDPVVVKSLTGDKSDNIAGYRLVKEITAIKIINKGLDEYLDSKGRSQFDLNTVLVDLSKNPYRNSNIDYIKSVEWNNHYSISDVRKILLEHKINQSDIVDRMSSFKIK